MSSERKFTLCIQDLLTLTYAWPSARNTGSSLAYVAGLCRARFAYTCPSIAAGAASWVNVNRPLCPAG